MTPIAMLEPQAAKRLFWSDLKRQARALRRQRLTLGAIADRVGVTVACVSRWCADMPEHAAAREQHYAARNAALAARGRQHRLYPAGSERLRNKLRGQGVAQAERIAVCQQVAAERRP